MWQGGQILRASAARVCGVAHYEGFIGQVHGVDTHLLEDLPAPGTAACVQWRYALRRLIQVREQAAVTAGQPFHIFDVQPGMTANAERWGLQCVEGAGNRLVLPIQGIGLLLLAPAQQVEKFRYPWPS